MITDTLTLTSATLLKEDVNTLVQSGIVVAFLVVFFDVCVIADQFAEEPTSGFKRMTSAKSKTFFNSKPIYRKRPQIALKSFSNFTMSRFEEKADRE